VETFRRGSRVQSREPSPTAVGGGFLLTGATLPFVGRFHRLIASGSEMNEFNQFASAMLAMVFAAVMLVAAQLFIEFRADKFPSVQVVQIASVVEKRPPALGQ
jgi:hypothetical protein